MLSSPRVAVAAAFLIHSTVAGTWAPRPPAIKALWLVVLLAVAVAASARGCDVRASLREQSGAGAARR